MAKFLLYQSKKSKPQTFLSFTILLTHFLDNKNSFPETLACGTTITSAL